MFRSRVGVANLLLPLVGTSATRREATLRRLREVLDRKVDLQVNDPNSDRVFEYLVAKQLIGPHPRRTGRYTKHVLEREGASWVARTTRGEVIDRLPVFQTDLWFADPRLRSTVGVPTPENSDEVVEFCESVGLISKARGSKTTEGQVAATLRGLSPADDNPFVLGLEGAALLRQLLSHDALMLFELTRQLASVSTSFRRDDVIPAFSAIAHRALETARERGMRSEEIRAVRAFQELVESTIERKANRVASRERASRTAKSPQAAGPGVLEHRLSPRLEWLTDFGVLRKPAAKNAFSYEQTPLVEVLSSQLDALLRRETTADDVALELMAQDAQWQYARASLRIETAEGALLKGVRSLQTSVGPVSIREACFVGAMHLDPIPSVDELRQRLLSWSARETGISLSGGRFNREPEMVHLAEKLVAG